MDKNRFVAEKLGLCWHEFNPDYDVYCKKCRRSVGMGNPDFSSDAGAVELLRLMMKRDDWSVFTSWHTINKHITTDHWIWNELITTPGALLDSAAEHFGWKEGE